MDPTEAYKNLLNARKENDGDTVRQLARDLRDWLKKGGFYPTGESKFEVDSVVLSSVYFSEFI